MVGYKIENDRVVVSVNPKIYPLGVVYSAAYVFIDDVYVVLDGDPSEEIIVYLKLKENSKKKLDSVGGEFYNELLNYADYASRAKDTQKIREVILQRSLISNDPSLVKNSSESSFDFDDSDFDEFLKELEDEKDSGEKEDSELVAPWEDEKKY